MRVVRVNALPLVLQPETLYLVADPVDPAKCNPIFTGANGQPRSAIGPTGPEGPPGDGVEDPGDLTLIFDNRLI